MSRLRGRELLTSLMNRQHLESVVPLALEVVAHEPLAMVHSFPGDLLRGLMELPPEFWRRHPSLYEQYRSAVRSAAQARLKLPAEARLAFWSHLEIQGMLAAPSGTSAPRPELDEVNDASFDSFPASDAPPWSSMHAGAPPSTP
jgi:hypothetical protein